MKELKSEELKNIDGGVGYGEEWQTPGAVHGGILAASAVFGFFVGLFD
ncbi:hypothetical protein [Prolixibacter sp. NT017]|nr:hypothetical protein [Prolixibacter sp. NT017]GET27745.1 hypothetical protein NT017_40740 [Prolixibacter sp. NT017]